MYLEVRKKILVVVFIFVASGIFSIENIPQMVFIPGGKFIMGDNSIVLHNIIDNTDPVDLYTEHEVVLSDFYIGKYEVTVKEFLEFVKDTGFITRSQKESKEGDRYWEREAGKWRYPIGSVTYIGAVKYCEWLSEKTGETYRLPTEAEWEYAATGGKKQKYPWGNEYVRLDTETYWDQLNYIDADKYIKAVGTFPQDTSPFGICNMYGNVMEWVLDSWEPLFYENSTVVNPLNQISYSGTLKLNRGPIRGYISNEDQYGVKGRYYFGEYDESPSVGFRVVKETEKQMFNLPYELGTENYSAFGVVNDYWLRVREQPTLTGKKLGYLNKDDKVNIEKRTLGEIAIEGMKAYWYKVRTLKGLNGWVYGYFIDIKVEQQ